MFEEYAMSVTYLSHDEGNWAHASRIAERLGLELTVLTLREAEYAFGGDLLVLDLDHLPSDCKSKLFLQIGRGTLRDGVTVHSHRLAPAEVDTLRAAGVRVARRLTALILVPRTPIGSTVRA